MSARLVGGAALLAVALTVVPGKDAPVLPVAVESILCDKAAVEVVYPDTPETHVVAAAVCVERFAREYIGKLARETGMDGGR